MTRLIFSICLLFTITAQAQTSNPYNEGVEHLTAKRWKEAATAFERASQADLKDEDARVLHQGQDTSVVHREAGYIDAALFLHSASCDTLSLQQRRGHI